MTRDDAIEKRLDELRAAMQGDPWPEVVTEYEVEQAYPEPAGPIAPEVLEAGVQKAILRLLKAKLDADPSLNLRFAATTKSAVMNQLLIAARLRELAWVKIVKKGGRGRGLRYDVSELAETFYGKQLLAGLGHGTRKRALEKAELEALVEACKKVKLTLPEAIEPTTTERFFAEGS